MSSATPKFRLNSVFKQLMSVHWWMAGCFLLLLPSGQIMAGLQGEVSYRELLFATHKSLGVLVLLLLGWRVYLLVRVWGKKYRKHLPKLTGNWYFTTGLHSLLYLMMFAVPMSGYWLSNAYHTNNISLFGLPMPDLFPVNSDAASQAGVIHDRTSKAFVIFIFIHFTCQRKVVKANWRRLSTWTKTKWSKPN
ncbi:cytochrome b/b6 domain-containing protein [Chamaesiphon sp. VAR_48_metabat_135_sub]|uniref:cytochrome b n=1 Tax=Chamaesiphon sp. VAR_48_metabat_135_sub TaxID=2964699 RepID=UPI00286A48B4|nr:cytochrome b/b6 domain-containing protein [Chamaesiphon sp. VAR_48_metabat_135_sub]